jgi:hypothetical protein
LSSDGIQFKREPYTVTYLDLKGEPQTIRRVPPPKVHEMLPQDKVELTRQKNADFRAGDTLEVTGISPRQPNVLQVKNEAGQVSFVDYFDARLEEVIGLRPGEEPGQRPADSRYLLWP